MHLSKDFFVRQGQALESVAELRFVAYFYSTFFFIEGQKEMAIARLTRHAKRPYGFCAKMTAVAIMGLCFVFVWSLFSSSSSSVSTQRESFDDISEPVVAANNKAINSKTQSKEKEPQKHESSKEDQQVKTESDLDLSKDETKINRFASLFVNELV